MFSKKINLSLLLLLLVICVQAQETIVKGTIQGLTDPVILYYASGTGIKTDTAHVKNGQFTWKGQLSEPQKLNIVTPKGERKISADNVFLMDLYAGKGETVSITGHVDSIKLVRISGSTLQKEADAYSAFLKESLKALNDKKEELNKQWYAAGEDEKKVLLEKVKPVYDSISAQIFKLHEELLKQWVSEHPNSYFSIHLVTGFFDASKDFLEMKQLYDLLDPALVQKSEAGKKLSKELAFWKEKKRNILGETMLDFTLNSNEGKPVRFADFKGKYVLVDFWASWCGPCRAENPNVLAAYDRYKDKNFTVLGVSLDRKEDDWKKAIQEDKLPWTQVSDSKSEVSDYYGIYLIPATILVDPDGKIIATNLRGEALHKKLAGLLDK